MKKTPIMYETTTSFEYHPVQTEMNPSITHSSKSNVHNLSVLQSESENIPSSNTSSQHVINIPNNNTNSPSIDIDLSNLQSLRISYSNDNSKDNGITLMKQMHIINRESEITFENNNQTKYNSGADLKTPPKKTINQYQPQQNSITIYENVFDNGDDISTGNKCLMVSELDIQIKQSQEENVKKGINLEKEIFEKVNNNNKPNNVNGNNNNNHKNECKSSRIKMNNACTQTSGKENNTKVKGVYSSMKKVNSKQSFLELLQKMSNANSNNNTINNKNNISKYKKSSSQKKTNYTSSNRSSSLSNNNNNILNSGCSGVKNISVFMHNSSLHTGSNLSIDQQNIKKAKNLKIPLSGVKLPSHQKLTFTNYCTTEHSHNKSATSSNKVTKKRPRSQCKQSPHIAIIPSPNSSNKNSFINNNGALSLTKVKHNYSHNNSLTGHGSNSNNNNNHSCSNKNKSNYNFNQNVLQTMQSGNDGGSKKKKYLRINTTETRGKHVNSFFGNNKSGNRMTLPLSSRNSNEVSNGIRGISYQKNNNSKVSEGNSRVIKGSSNTSKGKKNKVKGHNSYVQLNKHNYNSGCGIKNIAVYKHKQLLFSNIPTNNKYNCIQNKKNK